MGKRKYETNEAELKPAKQQKGKDIPISESQDVGENKDTEDANEDALSDFNIKHFRKELNAKQGQTIALTQFLQVCTNPDMKHDYMLQYLKSGGNSHEILRQISTENKKNLTLATPTFHLFHLIILKVQSSLPHMISITEEACRYFLNTFMPTVEIMISEHSGPRHRKIILKLFTSMVTLNPDLGVEILNQAPLTPKHLQYIVEKPNYKEKDNVRTAFVHFITSFLVEGHLPLVKALLEKQGLLSLVIPGLVQDEADAVIMLLNILKTNVIENVNISKSLKLKTFSHIVIHNIFKIYNWKGPFEVEQQHSKSEMKLTITSLLSEIMLILFTSHKHGLYFIDKTLGTSDAHKNQNLYKALLSLKRPWENKAQCETIIQIVDRCPDLHRALITVIEQSFEPQNTPIWNNTAEFVIKLLDRIQPHDVIERMDQLNPIQVTNFIRFTTLPIPILKFLKQGVTTQDMFVTTKCVQVLVTMMETLKRYLEVLDNSNKYSVIELLKNRLEGFIPKHLPLPETLVMMIHHIMATGDDTKSASDIPAVSNVTTMIGLIDLLLLYHEIHPSCLEGIEGHLDMKSILAYASIQTSENVLLLKFKIVSLWLSLDPSAVSFKKPIFSDLFLIMLEAYTNDDDAISQQSKITLHNFLKITSIFECCEGEIDLVLHTLKNTKVEPASVFVEVMHYTISKDNELREAIQLHIKNSEIEDDAASGGLDKLLDDLSTDNINKLNCNIFIDEKIPSPFILGCLQVSKTSKQARSALKSFISLFSINLMHYCTSPQILTKMIEPYKTGAKPYISTWTEAPIALNDELACNDETLVKICNYILDDNVEFNEIFPQFEVVPKENAELTIRDLSLRWEPSLVTDNSELLAWSNMVTFYLLQLTTLDSLTESQLQRVTQCFDSIMAIAKKNKLINVCRKIVCNIFTNPLMLNYFCPVSKPKEMTKQLVTKFLIEVVEHYGIFLLHLHSSMKIMKPYQQKYVIELKKYLNGISKKKADVDNELTLKTLDRVGMSKKDTLEIVNLILKVDTKSTVTENNDLSLVIKILGIILINASTNSEVLPPKAVPRIFNLYTQILKDPETSVTMIDFESILKSYFEKQPHRVKLISKESFKIFFSSKVVRKSTSQLAAALLHRNSNLCDVFKEEIQNPEIIGLRELALPLGEAIVDHNYFIDQNKPLLDKIFNEYKSSIQKVLEKPHKVGQIYSGHWRFIRKLIYECMSIEDCIKFFEKVHKFETVEIFHTQLVQATFMKICVTSESAKRNHLINYFTMMINLLSAALKSGAEFQVLKNIVDNIESVAKISKGIKAFDTKDKDQFKKLTENVIWHNFCKSALKDSLKIKTVDESSDVIGPRLLSLLTNLIKLFYPLNHEDIVSLFDMVTSHSEFLNVMLSHHSTDVKSRLIEFLYVLILRNKSVMKSQQIPVYLSAYHATRNPSDRLLLTILYFYETNGQTVNEYKPYVWGDSGANYYSVRKNRTSSLWGHPTPNQIMNLLDKEVVENTVKHFPVNQKLDYKYELPPISETDIDMSSILTERLKSDSVFTVNKRKDVTAFVESLILRNKYDRPLAQTKEMELTSSSHADGDEIKDIYDPAFILPIMSQLLAPGSVVSCFKLIRAGLLGIPLSALGSFCPAMRAAGYHVLHRFCQQLETETKHRNDKLLLNDFFDTIRQSLSTAIVTAQKENIKDQKNPRLPAIAALYLARALNVATAPFDPLYKPVNNFLIAKQQIDLTVIPDFLSLFHDSDVESGDRRLWILAIMRDGTKTMSDVNLIFKTMAPKMVMDFYSTVLADRKTKEGILDFLSSLVSVPRAAEIMMEGYGLISWLNFVIKEFKVEDRVLVKSAIDLLNHLCRSVSVNAFARMLNELRRNGDSSESEKKVEYVYVDVNKFGELKINKEIENELLHHLISLLPFVSSVSIDDQVVYLNALNLLSKRTLKALTKNDITMLVKSCSEGIESSESVQLLLKAVSTNDVNILKVPNFSLNLDEPESYSTKLNIVKRLWSLVKNYF